MILYYLAMQNVVVPSVPYIHQNSETHQIFYSQ
jgi:hypothetical protein